MNGYEIIYNLKKRGIKVKDIAAQLDVTGPAVSHVIHGKYASRRISQAVAGAIKMPLEEVFPKYANRNEP